MFLTRAFKVLVIALVAFVFAGVATAFAAANTVPDSYAGDGSGTISGYTVSNIQYHLNATDPASIDSVSFTLSASAGTVKIKLVAAGSTWYDCTNTSGNNWSCTTTGATVLSADQLRVIATQ
jgi:hypothetical protein